MLMAPVLNQLGTSLGNADNNMVIVTGSYIQDLSAVSLNADEIEDLQPVVLEDVLNRLPGVRAVTTGGVGGGSFVSIRGGEPNYSLILIDGINVTNPSNSRGGGFDFAQIDLRAIDSIELVPTGRSAIHGSDALSGIIGITLKTPKQNETRYKANAFTDSAEAFGAAGTVLTGWDSGGILVNGSYFDSGDLTKGSELDRIQGMVRIQQELGDFNLSALGLISQSERMAFPEASGGPRLAALQDLERRDSDLYVIGGSVFHQTSETLRTHLKISYSKEEVEADSPAIVPGTLSGVPAIYSLTEFERFEATAHFQYEVMPELQMAIGGNFTQENAVSQGTIDFGFLIPTAFEIRRDEIAAFVEAVWTPHDDLVLSAAGRIDQFDNNETETTGQLSASYRLGGSGLSVYSTLAEGFRRPSLFALAFPLTSNPDLLPERSRTFELGLDWELADHAKLKLTYFDNQFRDQVDFEPTLFTHVNRDKVDTQGFELSGHWSVSDTIKASASITHIDIGGDIILRARPKWQGAAQLDWEYSESLEVGLAGRFNSSFFETSVPTGLISLEGYSEIDIFAKYRVSENMSIQAALRNIADSKYEDAIGFPAPGRNVRAKVSFDF